MTENHEAEKYKEGKMSLKVHSIKRWKTKKKKKNPLGCQEKRKEKKAR